MNIAFIDLKRQYQALEKDIRQAMDRVLENCSFIMGPEVIRLEEELAAFAGVKRAVVCSSGTDALLMPLMAYNVKSGDAIFTTPFTFIATAEVIALLGATPVFVDIDPLTYNLDPVKLRAAVDRIEKDGQLRPAGIIPVDLFGLPADYEPIMALAEDRGLFVLEDAAQSFGGCYQGRPAGGLGHVGATSFFPAKPLGCYGDGGAIFTDDENLIEIIKSMRVHGQGLDKYNNVRVGLNARLDTLQAAVLLVKLRAFPEELETRQKVARQYRQGLAGHVTTPHVPEGYYSAWAQYTVRSRHRGRIQTALKEAGIPTAIYYPKPLHLQEAFSFLGCREGDFPVSEQAAQEVFSLPMHPYLSESELDYIVARIIEALPDRD